MFSIRIMTPSDYQEAYALWTGTPGMGLNSLDDSCEGITKYLHRNPSTSFVAVENGCIVGTILCGHDGRRGFIYHTAVSLQNRRRGIGRSLVQHALQALQKEDIAKVALAAFARNEEGNQFWQSIGFTLREDIVYRNCTLIDAIRFDT